MSELEHQLRLLIDQYGPAEVRKHVAKLTGAPKRSVRRTAVEYVSGMSVPEDHKERLITLARLFEQGRFLPNSADIRNLFEALGGKPVEVKARRAAVPMIFRFLASCSRERLDRIISQGMFSGPTELAPIAEAIKATSARTRQKTRPEEISDGD